MALALVATLVAACPPPGHAQPDQAPPDTSTTAPAPPDTSGARITTWPALPDSAAEAAERALQQARAVAARPERKAGRFDAPRWVMLRSLLLPGWGQLHNRAWLKAIGVAAAEISMGKQLYDDERELDRLSRLADQAQAANDEEAFSAAVEAYNARLSESTNRRWLLGGLLAYALVDAYVDAHFIHFNVEFDTDPAPAGGASSRPSARVGLEWTF